MNPPGSTDKPLDLTSEAAQKETEAKAAAEKSKETAAAAPDQREKALSTATESMRREVAAKQAALTAAGRSLDAPTQRYLEQYFQSAIHRFDADKDGKISEQESKAFHDSMLKKTNEIVGGMIEAGKAEKKMEKAAEKAEKIDTKEAQKSLESVQALGDLTDLQQANGELQKIQSQNGAFQQTVQTQLEGVQQFSKSFNEFQQAQEGFGHFAQLWDAVVNSTERSLAIASMKASLETTRGAVDATLTALRDKQKILDANGEKIKAAFTRTRQEAIKAREEKKAEVEKAKQEQADQIEARKKEYARLEAEKKKLEARRKEIAERQAKSEKIRADWRQQNEQERIKTQKTNCGHEKDDILAELHGFGLILDNPDIPPSVKDGIRKDYEAAKARQQKNKLALEVIDLKEKSGAEFAQKLDADQKIAAQELQTADSHLARQRESQLSLQQNIDLLNDLQSQYATSSAEVDKYYNEKIKILDEQAESVDDFVLKRSMARQQSITALEQAKTSLAGLSVEAKGFWHFINPLEAVGSLSKGIGGALHSAAQSIDGWTRDVLNMTRNSKDTADQMIYYGTQFLSIFSGFVSGGLELGGGIYTLAGGLVSDIGSIGTALMTRDSKKMHFETFAGLGAIIGYDAAKGSFSWEKVGETWGAMGKAIIGYGENWGTHKDPVIGKEEQRDEYGTAIGKSVFNVLSMFVGVGEAKLAAQGGATAARLGAATSTIGRAGLAAKVARLAALDAAKAAGKTAGMFTGRGAQMLAFAKSLTQSLRPAALAEATKAAKIAPGGKATQAAAFGRSIASSALDTTVAAGRAAGRGLGTARQAAGRGMRGLRDAWQHPWRTAGRAAIGTAKGVGWTIQKAAQITYAIAVMPYRLTWGFGKAVRNFGRGGTDRAALLAAKSSQRFGAAAETMRLYGDDYAKAQQSLRRIIDDDPVLSKKAMEIENASLSPEVAAQRRLALEAEAAQKLVITEPRLAEAYLGFRRASNQLMEEAEGYLAATRKEVGRVSKNPEMRTAFEEYERLSLEAKSGTKEARTALEEFENDPLRMGNARRYREAQAAEAELAALRTRIDDFQQSIVGQHSDDASRLADEVNEARTVHAPDDAPAYGTAITDTPSFAKEFRRDFDRAYAAKNYQAVEELLDSLGTYRDGRLAEVLEGFRRRRELAIPDEPSLAARVTDKWRQQLVEELDQAHGSGKFTSYQAFRDRYYGRSAALDQYIDWVEDIYKKHPAEAHSLVFSGERDFSAALKANQKVSLDLFDQWAEKISEGKSLEVLRAEMQAANLPTHWQAALEQMQQRVALRNRQIALTADSALNRIRAEYSRVVSPEMTAAEAAQRLEKVYGSEGLGQSAARRPGIREVAKDIRLKDGLFDLRVMDDGTIRLINKTDGTPVLPQTKAAQAAPAPTSAPAAAPAAPVSAPAPAPATPPRLSAAMRGLESREAKLQTAIDNNATWKDLAAQGDAGLLIARGRARIAEYRSQVGTVHLERRLQSLQDDLKNAKNVNNPADIQKAQTALDDFTREPAYLEYQRYRAAERAINNAETIFNQGKNPIDFLRNAQKNLVRNELIERLNTRLTPEEAAELLARESLPAARGGVGGARLAGQVDDLGTVTLKGGKKYHVRMLENGELRLFDDADQVITPTVRPAAAPTTAPAAAAKPAPSAAPAIPRKAPAERMREAVAIREQAIRDIGRGRERVLQLEERIPQLQQRIEAMEVRGVSGPRLKAARESLISLQDELERLNVTVSENAQKLWATRGDYWKARLLQKGQDIRQYVAVQRRIDWLKAKNKTLGELAAKGVQVLRNPAKNLWESLKKQADSTLPLGEGATAEFAKMYLFARAGLEVTNRLEALQAAAAPRLPAALPILAELRRDQYNILAEIQKGADRSLGLPGDEEFAALSPQEQTAALGAAYRRLEGGGGLPEEGGIYTDVQKQYIGDKKQLARQALAGLGTEGTELTPQSVTAALDNAFGPQGLNDSRVDYQIEVEGLKIKVDQDGNRTYEGIDGWVASAPTRTLVRGVLGEVEQNHGAITPAELAKANQNKPVNDLEEFQKYLQEAVRAAVAGKNGDLTLQPGAIVESPSLNAEGEPLFTARVDANSKIEVTVDPAWASATYEAIKSRPDQQVKPAPERIAGAPRRAPRRAPETSETPDDENWDPDNPYS